MRGKGGLHALSLHAEHVATAGRRMVWQVGVSQDRYKAFCLHAPQSHRQHMQHLAPKMGCQLLFKRCTPAWHRTFCVMPGLQHASHLGHLSVSCCMMLCKAQHMRSCVAGVAPHLAADGTLAVHGRILARMRY